MTSDADANAEANALFWKAYATSILQLVTGGSTDIGPDSRIFIASSNHSAIPGGSQVPQPITNNGIYNLANNLLDANGGITFNPNAAGGGYFEKILDYLETIKPVPRNMTPQSMTLLQAANDSVAAANKAAETSYDDENVRFDAANARAKGTLVWEKWYPTHALTYVAALERVELAEGELIFQNDNVYGPGVGQFNKHVALLRTIQDTTSALQPGINMQASADDLTMDPVTFLVSAPSSLNLFTFPTYTVTEYGEMINTWMLADPSSIKPVFKSTISSSVGRQFDAKSFGHSDSSSSSGIDLGIFSDGSGSSSSADSSSFQCGKWVDDITLTLSVNFAQMMTISPGAWNVNVKDLVGKMGATPPPFVSTSVRPTQALFASGVGLTVKFGASAASEFDTYYKQTATSSGGFSIFGFHCDNNSTSSSVNQVTSHGDWHVSTGTLTITPAATAHNAQLLAVMGEIITL